MPILISLSLLTCALSPRQETPRAPAAGAAAPSFRDARTILWQSGVENAYPRWSSDGRRILYQSNRAGKWQVYVMDADGTHDRPLTSGEANDNFPDWSPDDARVAFVSDRDGNEEVYVMGMDGSGLTNLSRHPARDIHPYWAPDGRMLLFNSTRDADRLQIYEVGADGAGLRRLVASPDDDTCARVDSTGERFLYLTNLSSGQDDVMLRRRDGSDPVNLTHDPAPDGWPAWTPDGRVVFSSARGGGFRLFLMDASGSAARPLSAPDAPFEDARACVSRDGKRVVFNRTDGRSIGICVLDLPATVDAGAPARDG